MTQSRNSSLIFAGFIAMKGLLIESHWDNALWRCHICNLPIPNLNAWETESVIRKTGRRAFWLWSYTDDTSNVWGWQRCSAFHVILIFMRTKTICLLFQAGSTQWNAQWLTLLSVTVRVYICKVTNFNILMYQRKTFWSGTSWG